MNAGTVTAKRVHRCNICGVNLEDKRWVYSPTKRRRYCHPYDWNACSERSLKQKAKR